MHTWFLRSLALKVTRGVSVHILLTRTNHKATSCKMIENCSSSPGSNFPVTPLYFEEERFVVAN